MRARNIKPGFFKNEDLVEIDPMGRLLFIGLWMMADREGRLADRPRRIKMEIFPGDNCDVDALLDDLQHWGFIVRYEVDGSRFIQVVNFLKHQNPNPKEVASVIPAPQSTAGRNPDCIQNVSGLNPDCIQNISDTAESFLPESFLPESPFLEDTLSPMNGEDVSDGMAVAGSPAEIAVTCRKYGVRCQAQNPLVLELAKQKVSMGALREACEEAKRNNATSVKYVVKVLESWVQKARSMRVGDAKPPDRPANGSTFRQQAVENAKKAGKLIFGEDYDTTEIS